MAVVPAVGGAEIIAASCSRADVLAAVSAAQDGDTVLIPAGTATWTDGLTITKGIHLKGAGQMWGNKPEIKLQIQVLDRNAGLFGLWGQGVDGAQYPAPRQVGMGHANGGYTNHSVAFAHPNVDLASGLDNNSPPVYLGDLCPWYQWGNTGGGNCAAPGIMMSGYNNGTPDDPADYIQVGRDWINGKKPGYTPYTYPHPLTQENDAPPPLPEGNQGIAALFPGDVNIQSHADVIFADDFESYTTAGQLTTRWDESYHLANTRIATETNHVFAGSKAVEFKVPIQTTETSNTALKYVNPKLDVLFVRCYTKFDPGFLTYGSSHNGIGIQANYSGPGVPANGTNKFYVGLENSGFSGETSPGPTHLYVYHPEQRDIWGDHWYPDGRVVPFDYLPGDYGPHFVPRSNFTPARDRWYCIEMMVKANTPGQRDGRIAYWIDGLLAADFLNIRLRDVETLKIDKFFVGFHINGTTTRINTKWYDNVVAARSYIGPMSGGASDTNAPSVILTAPAAGATVSNTVSISATATDNVAVAGVQFRLDGASNLGAEDTVSPYSFSWNTAGAANGIHALTAVARDTVGNLATSAFITVTVTNAGGGGIMGHSGEGTSTDNISDGSGSYINASRFLAGSSFTATGIRAKVLGITGRYKCAIYSDNGGVPQALLQATAEAVNPSTGWQTFALTACQAIQGGTYYWLAIWSDLHSTSAGIYCDPSGGTTRWTGVQPYGTWPDPVTTTGGGSFRYCIYAEGVAGGDVLVNGISSAWLVQYFGSTNAPGGGVADDPDGDGHDNYAEYIAGTVPTNGASVLRILGLRPDGAGMQMWFQGVAGRRYRLEYRDDLSAAGWSVLLSNAAGTGAENHLTDTNPPACRFYRLGVRME